VTRIPDKIYSRLPKRLPDKLKFSNYCLQFTDSGYVEVANDPSINIETGSFFVEAWIWLDPTATNSEPRIAGKVDGSYSINFAVNRNNLYVKNYTYDGTTARIVQTPNNVITPRRWHHVVLNCSPTQQSIYVDGELKAGPTSRHAVTNTEVLCIGARTAIHAFWKGFIDEFRYGPVELTPHQIRESFRRGYARRELDCRVVLRMEEGLGLTAYDLSGYGNHGSLLPADNPPLWRKVAKYELLAETEL